MELLLSYDYLTDFGNVLFPSSHRVPYSVPLSTKRDNLTDKKGHFLSRSPLSRVPCLNKRHGTAVVAYSMLLRNVRVLGTAVQLPCT